jgi:hypothetical protein
MEDISQFQTTNSSNVSIGKRLYETARSMNVEKDKEINSFRQESIKKTQEECTFTPKINKNSIILSFKVILFKFRKIITQIIESLTVCRTVLQN